MSKTKNSARNLLAGALLLSAALWALSPSEIAAAMAAAPALGTEITVTPAAEPEGAWQAQAVISNLETGEVLSAPRIVFRAGEAALVQSGVEGRDRIDLEIMVDNRGLEGRPVVRYRVEYRQGGVVTASHSMTVQP